MKITNKADRDRDRNGRRELFRTALQLIGSGLFESLRAAETAGAADALKPGGDSTDGGRPECARPSSEKGE